MRDKFTEWIENGIAPSKYNVNIVGNQPGTCPICRLYNNIFSLLTDSRMTQATLPTGECVHIITGGLARNKQRFDKLLYCSVWETIDIHRLFVAAGYPQLYSMCSLFDSMNWEAHIEKINGDDAIVLRDKQSVAVAPAVYTADNVATTSESKIPFKVNLLTTNNSYESIAECAVNIKNADEFAENLNKSPYVKGNEWKADVFNESVYIRDNNRYIFIKLNKEEK